MHKKIIKLLTVCLSAGALLFAVSAFFRTTVESDIRKFCKDEKEYYSYLKSIEFENVSFDLISVEMGDNFWKIAKNHDISIDSLIGVNLFWEDLLARVGQTVAVPDCNGVLEFISSFDEIESLARKYEVSADDIEVQKTPRLYRFYYEFDSGRMPVAVFVKNVRPRISGMTASLAGKYELREMFRSPLGGRLTSFFGNRRHPIYRRQKFHNGLDIAAKYGTYVGAARAGVVTSVGWMGAYGKAVIIEHDRGYKTLYGHLSRIYAKPGQKVSAGRLIGRVGSTGLSTGPHLHFTVWHNGRLLNPMKVLW